jgi:hypothetical protein
MAEMNENRCRLSLAMACSWFSMTIILIFWYLIFCWSMLSTCPMEHSECAAATKPKGEAALCQEAGVALSLLSACAVVGMLHIRRRVSRMDGALFGRIDGSILLRVDG